ncbi:hypothetical protein MHU86_25231 [Fragilaria crotonensis]|nr:hypothetical protein MHU86_25231 [Fragilaria crotonensis]
MQIKRLQALVYWVKDHDKRGLQAQPEMWTREVMLAAMARKESDHNLDKVDIDIIDPGKCQTDAGWDNWQIGFVNKLSAIMGPRRSQSTMSYALNGITPTSCFSTMMR